jgi:hypothetical protein
MRILKLLLLKSIAQLTLLCFVLFWPSILRAQSQNIIVDLSMLDGIEINSENVFNYQIINNGGRPRDAMVVGTLRYRNSELRFSYSFNTTLQNGNNVFSKNNVISPSWDFSSSALRELFLTYNKLPQGTYEYCVEIKLKEISAENYLAEPINGCIYYTVADIFLINLIEPENDAKLYELYPMLSWTVNYPFASELTYRLRVAELKEGQNNENAITRNNPVYQDNRVLQTGLTYPVTAKPLKKFQPYVWTVDAYYKGILLGGAEVWKFTIIEDSLLKSLPKNTSYIDVRLENGNNALYAVGELKLKYVLDEARSELLKFQLFNSSGKEVTMKQNQQMIKYGDNRFVLNLSEDYKLTHMGKYSLTVTNSKGRKYNLAFLYLNPDFLTEE